MLGCSIPLISSSDTIKANTGGSYPTNYNVYLDAPYI